MWLCDDECVEQYQEMIRKYEINEERCRSTSTYVITIPTIESWVNIFDGWGFPRIIEEIQPDNPMNYDELNEASREAGEWYED